MQDKDDSSADSLGFSSASASSSVPASNSSSTSSSSLAPGAASDSALPNPASAPGEEPAAPSPRPLAALLETSSSPFLTGVSHFSHSFQEHSRHHSAGLPAPWHSDNSHTGQVGSPPPVNPITALPSHRSYPSLNQAVASLASADSAGKRQSRKVKDDQAMESTPVKKARTGASPPRRLDMLSDAMFPPLATVQAAAQVHREDAVSPLFFSHAPSRHFPRPHSVPVSDVTSVILAQAREDTAGAVTTLKLPRASVSSTSAALSGSTPSSMDMSAPSLSPDMRSLPPGLQMLQGVGVLELLEHDDRPTFLVDLASSANAHRPSLPIAYYNASLRATESIHNLLNPEQENATADPPDDFVGFKSWVMASGADSAEAHSSTYEYGGITWVCTTLRRRFRFISGNVTYHATRPASPVPMIEEEEEDEEQHQEEEAPMLEQDINDQCISTPVTPVADILEPSDYFGNATAKPTIESVDTTDTTPATGTIEPVYDINRRHPDDFTNEVLQSQPVRSTFDWTRIPYSDSLPEHIKLAKSVDWASTPLGPMSEWSYNLRAMANLIMGSPNPAAMYWGREYVVLYNAAYVALAGSKHPALMGKRYMDGWIELNEVFTPVFKSAWDSGQATMKHDNQLFINRHGFLEETFFSWSVIPILGEEGEVVGLYNPCFENTRRRINERRMLTLREIGERTATAASVNEFWPLVRKGLAFNEYDIPFSMIYSVKDETESEVSSLHSGSLVHCPQLILEGSPGVPEGHVAAPPTLDLRTSEEGFAPYVRQSLAGGGAPVVLSEEDGTLPKHLIEGFEWRGFGDPCRTIVVFPVIPTTTGEAVTGFIVLGINPRRPYDDDYKLFIHLLSRQLATSMASVLLFEEEIRRGQRAAHLAALDRQELSKQLWQRTQEASELEYKFTRMAEFAPVGMFIADERGHINYCNDMWWQISRHARAEQIGTAWMDSVRVEDRPVLEAGWTRLLEQKVTVSLEFRFNCSQLCGDHTVDTWVLMSAFPEKDADGNLASIFGCITDISSQKWAEKVQSERREEAVELKRQQENFIDITSHEMRNPLSAILQCVDQIANSITSFTSHADRAEIDTLLESCLDAANTINLCASHQKRIVDDILTLSKLDSNLLAVTPVDEQPIKVVHRTLKMFESELLAHDIDFEFRVDNSFETYGVNWAKLDPSRLRQVLINLMTNAIKFTQGREKRAIIVSMCATKDISEITSQGTFYFERNDVQRTVGMDIDNEEEWGTGERFNIHCSVEDTGAGLGDEEMKVLFQRFQQASPRTHVQYGGSGLGLFISRILTEMQGGQIGVSSQKDCGSKFSFYVQSRKCLNPPAQYEHITPFKLERKIQSPATGGPPASCPASRSQSDAGRSPLFDVLIVEDNIVNQKVLQRQLRNYGNNTFVANHGKEALQTLQKSRFWAGQEAEGVDISVILMDLEMPVMDGMTCARRIRELEKEGTIIKHIPIIAVTAYARPEQIENAKAAGIDDVISKPFRIPELLPKIEELVVKYQSLSVSNNA
ncbi:histidine kinase [Trichoderma arundinaceum]|uniref:Histidine kinase n=1 Tax=Trichoderma arundinaceum TaxID=490622 RepID=A0A395NG67_TRIAR|nr:histidine kinase [Trichoderma arundinaceum]